MTPKGVVWPAKPSAVPGTDLVYWNILKTNYLQRVERDLSLTPEQTKRIEVIISESQKRTKELSDAMAPKIREEVRRARDRMRAELTPEQRVRYDRLVTKPRPPRKPATTVHAQPAPTNKPSSAPVLK